jgi:4'-phosphopantetheinyl transferase
VVRIQTIVKPNFCLHYADLRERLDALAWSLLTSCLSATEHVQMLRFLRPIDQQRYALGRYLLRSHVLGLPGCALGASASQAKSVVIELSPTGKPFVRDAGVHFNLSHSGNWVVAAFAEMPIGIDIEQIRESVEPGMLALALNQQELDFLKCAPVDKQSFAFYRLWTRKEAVLKWLGQGLQIEPSSFAVLDDQGQLQGQDYQIETWQFDSEHWLSLAHAADKVVACARKVE